MHRNLNIPALEPLRFLPLLAVNVVPLLGVIFLGWDILDILSLYWLENCVLCLIYAVRIFASGWDRPAKPTEAELRTKDAATASVERLAANHWVHVVLRSITAGTFLFVFACFAFFHGFCLFYFLGTIPVEQLFWDQVAALAKAPDWRGPVGWGITFSALFYSISLIGKWFRDGTYRTSSVKGEFWNFCQRVIVLHMAVTFAVLTTQETAAPMRGLVALIVTKLVLELVVFVWAQGTERKRHEVSALARG